MENNKGIRSFLLKGTIYKLVQSFLGSEKNLRWLAKEIIEKNNCKKIVDCGCGPAQILSHFSPEMEYIGIDINKSYLEEARKKYGNRGKFIQATFDELLADKNDKYGIGKVDVVISLGVLHHLDDELAFKFLKFSQRILKEKGRFIALEPTYLLKQSFLSRYFVSKDRGQFVRYEQQWKMLIGKHFSHYETHILTGLLKIPYTHILIEAIKGKLRQL